VERAAPDSLPKTVWGYEKIRPAASLLARGVAQHLFCVVGVGLIEEVDDIVPKARRHIEGNAEAAPPNMMERPGFQVRPVHRGSGGSNWIVMAEQRAGGQASSR